MRAVFSGVPSRLALIVVIVAVTLAHASAAFAAHPGKPRATGVTKLTISPKKPKATDSINVAFRAGKLRSDERYLVGIGEGFIRGPSEQCTSGYYAVVHGRKRLRQLVELTLYPNQAIAPGADAHFYGSGPAAGARRFCPGSTTITVGRIDPDGNVRLITSRAVRIVKDSEYPEEPGTPAKISVLEGSSLTVQAPGRADRTVPVGGVLRGLIPGQFRPNSDVVIDSMTGALNLSSISPDPLCAGPTYKLEFGLGQGGPSKMVLIASGRAELSLDLLADPLSLAGCAAPASPGKSAVTVSGQVTADGLIRLPLSGTLAGVQIAPDVSATVTFNLLVKVDLSGRG